MEVAGTVKVTAGEAEARGERSGWDDSRTEWRGRTERRRGRRSRTNASSFGVQTLVFCGILLSVASYVLVRNRQRLTRLLAEHDPALKRTAAVPEAQPLSLDVLSPLGIAVAGPEARDTVDGAESTAGVALTKKLARQHYALSLFLAATAIGFALYSRRLPFLDLFRRPAAPPEEPSLVRHVFQLFSGGPQVERTAAEIERLAYEQLGSGSSQTSDTSVGDVVAWLFGGFEARGEPEEASVASYLVGVVQDGLAQLTGAIQGAGSVNVGPSFGKWFVFAATLYFAGWVTSRTIRAETRDVEGRWGVVERQAVEREALADEGERVADRLTRQVAQLETRRQEAEADAERQRTERLEKSRRGLQLLREVVQRAEADVASMEEAVRKAEEQKASREAQQDEAAALAAQMVAANEEVEHLEARLVVLEEELNAVSLNVAKLMMLAEGLPPKKAGGKAKRTSPESESAEMERVESETGVMLTVLDELNDRVAAATTQRDAIAARVGSLAADSRRKAERPQREKEEESKQQMQMMCEEIERIEAERTAVNARVADLEARVERATSKIEEIRQAAESNVDATKLRSVIRATEG
ncbi:conserved hypothetical protein [Neospora caninum Liverpool]|uniref:Uncharacterized protein n=1 Tax=Neospora caninum (strain Liverpool) TaxID=572307 RepID=F0VB92_NEOCL|nr:conserved hypothetical protein [Neospora caninum Liverpool]CBZ50876.1 conserved hypothetical protein [Neospora caninum Liverpool]CEL68178.1 TPA: hypothetical protein BN1204_039510 [Neospora caninum Liverpool]|eukprot:XP_003880909.1 conserved hypothetical protein [Neospora caninum Liverpool]